MKKIITIVTVLMAAITGYTQLPNGAEPPVSTTIEKVNNPSPAAPGLYNINTKAVRNFYDSYGDNQNETWYATDYGFRAKFKQDNIAYMVDYNKKGAWSQTIKTYDESKLPKDIREKVRRQYYDQHIFLVSEINKTNENFYLVSIEDKNSWQMLRVTADEMDVVAEYEK